MILKNYHILSKFKLKKALHGLSDTYFKKSIIGVLLVAMILQAFYLDPLQVGTMNASLQATASIYSDQAPSNLVLILVEKDLFEDQDDYTNQYTENYSEVSSSSIQERIERYARDIQRSSYFQESDLDTEVTIIPVSQFQAPAEIASLLKQAYHQNLDQLEDSQLSGVVLMGEVPLPVVNKSGNLFTSLYPYTDFEDPSFVLDNQNQYFIPTQVNNPIPEVWHGVINLDSPQAISEYLDKNHLYYEGVEDFQDFDQSIFFSEPVHDASSFNQDLYSSYLTYTSVIEEFAYNRFSRKLLDFLGQNSSGFVAEAIRAGQSNQSDQIKVPDIFTRSNIEKFVTPLTDVFTVALRDQRDALLSTGRYQDSQYNSGLLGIAKLDELSSLYLKEVNQILENEIDDILDDIQQDINLVQGARLTPVLQFENQDGDIVDQQLDPIYFVNHSRQGDLLQLYLNLVPGLAQSTANLPTDEILDILFANPNSPLGQEDLIQNATLKINGTRFQDINTPAQCRLFRGGGTTNPLDKTVRTHRGLVIDRDPESPQTEVCYNPFDPDDPEETWTKVDRSPGLLNLRDNVYKCTTFAGRDLQDFHRMDEVQLDYQSPLTAQSCNGMRTTQDYLDLLKVEYARTDSEAELNQAIQELNSIPNYQDLTLATYQGQTITLGQFLSILPTYRSVQLTQNQSFDWHAFSSQILANPVRNEFSVNLQSTANPELRSLRLEVQQYQTSKNIPSLVKHADPTPGIISNAYDAINPDLPINATRYVTFMDKNGESQELVYPNLFKADSYADFLQDVSQLESALTRLSKTNQDYTGRLTNLISLPQDQYQSDQLVGANSAKVEYFTNWLTYDLNQKYEQAHSLILSKDRPFTLNNFSDSFEITHLTGNTTNSNLDFNILDFTDFDQILPPEDSLEGQHKAQTQEELIQSQQSAADDSIDLFTYFTDYLPSWYEEQQSRISQIISPEKPEISTADELFGSEDVTPDLVQVTASSVVPTTSSPLELNLTLVNQEGIKSLQSISQTVTSNLPQSTQDQLDQDPETPGVQVNYFSGESTIVFEVDQPGDYTITFPTNSYSFSIYEDPQLNIDLSQSTTQASPDSEIEVSITLQEGGQLINFPKPTLSLDTTTTRSSLVYTGDSPSGDTVHTYTLTPGTKSGQINLSTSLPAMSVAPAGTSLTVSPADPAKVKFTNSKTKINSTSTTEVEAVIVDEYDNPILQNFQNLQIQYDQTSSLQIFPQEVDFNLGKATLQFQAQPLSFGNIFFQITDGSSLQGFHQLQISSQLSLDRVGPDLNSLIFNSFTSTPQLQNEAYRSIFTDSKVQASSTLTTSLDDTLPYLYIHPSGGVLQPSPDLVSSQTTFQSGVFTTIFNDNQNQQIVELSTNLSNKILSNQAQPDQINFTSLNPNLELTETNISLQGQNLVEINPNQTIQSINEQVYLQIVDNTYYSVNLIYQGQAFANLTFQPTSSNEVTIKPNSRNPNLEYKLQTTLPSSSQPLGYKFYNPKVLLDSSQLPSSFDVRSHDSLETPQVGLVQGSKLLHLLSSGTPIGEANRPHLSEAGIVLGDPLISLPKLNNSSLSNMNFDETIGQFVSRKSDSQLVDILSLPESNKTVIAYQDGTVGLLDNETLRYLPEFLNVPNGIKSLHVANFQNNQETIVFLTDQECVQGDSCIYVFNDFTQDSKTGQTQLVSPNLSSQDGYELDRNNLSTLNRLDLNLSTKVSQILIQDMNNDDLDDLILEAEDQILYLFWNQEGQILPTPNALGHTRIPFQEEEYLLQKILINNISTPQEPTATLSIPTNPSQTTTTFQTPSGPIQSNQIQESQALDFYNLSSLASLQNSTARVRDIDGNTLESGDILEYTITLNNSSTTSYQNLKLSVPIPSNQVLTTSSLNPSSASFIQTTNQSNRKTLISGINLASQGTTIVSFRTTYQRPTTSDQSIIKVNQPEQENILPVQDGYPDLKILLPESDSITYFYSDYDSSNNVLSFRRFDQQQTPQAQNPNQTTLESVLNLPANPTNQTTDQQEQVANSLAEQTIKNDSNNDGIIDIYDGSDSLNSAGSKVENLVKDLSCGDGGCLAVPKNEAFLVPGDIPGTELPAFAWGCPPSPTGAFIPFWPPQPYQACSGGRIYISPTLTGEFAGSVCIGPHLLGVCYTFSITDLGALCDAINKKLQDVITKASDFVETSSGGAITVGGGSGQSQQSNIQIPGFPAVLTKWVTNQWKEINQKLLDPPDINIIYPDPQSVVGYVTPINSQDQRNYFFTDPYPNCNSEEDFRNNPSQCGNLSTYNDVLVAKQTAKSRAEFNSADDLQSILEEVALMPLFDINYQTVYVNYPWIEEKELTKYKTQLISLQDQIKLEIFVKGSQWGCFANTDYDSITSIQTALDNGDFLQSIASVSNQGGNVQTACIRLAAGLEGIDLNIKENLQRITEYREIPKNIVRVENFVANYADQILQYAEIILTNTLGWLTENTSALVQWEQAIHDVEAMVEELKIILNFSSDFMESCDDCRSNRTNDGIQSLITLFANLAPDLPVIEIPSWPDITLDVSEVKAGVDITLPDFEFKKDPITLPDLDLQFALPDTPDAALGLQGSGVDIDGFDLELYLDAFQVPLLPEPPNLDELEIMQDLPELPSLEIPQLPSLPKPPSIKNFSTNFTKQVEPTIKVLTRLVRIYCLISKGLVPMPESQIKDQIETMTNRPLTPVLPVDVSFQLPNDALQAQYIEEIIFKLTTQLNLEFDQIQENSQQLADQLNSFSSNITDQIEDGLEENFDFLDQGEVNLLGDDLTETIENLPETTSFSDAIHSMDQLAQSLNNQIPKEINLTATSQAFVPNKANSTLTLQEYKSHPIVAQKLSQPDTRTQFASITKPSLQTPIKSDSFQLTNSYIAQATSIQSELPTYDPEEGVYTIDEQGNVQKLIAYNTPTQSQNQVEIVDLDDDGDEDIIYSLENSLYIKQNNHVQTNQSSSISSPRIFQLEDLTNELDLDSLKTPDINFNFQHNQVSFSLPSNLLDKPLLLDTYKTTITDTESYQRYLIVPEELDQDISEDEFDKVIRVNSNNSVSLPLSNGNYLARLSLITETRTHILQSNIALTPNTCGDNIPPNIQLNSDQEVDVPLFSTYTVDVSQTYDSESSISQIYIDNNLTSDSDQDGDPTNDNNLQGQENPATAIFQLGPFNQIQTRRYNIHAEDINGNTSNVILTINVVPPGITITKGQDNQINGQLDPISGNTPITLIRQRNGVLAPIANLATDASGQFQFQPDNSSTSVVVKDINNRDLFRINKITGTIQTLDPSATLEFTPWNPSEENPSNTSITLNLNDQPLTRVQKISDSAILPILSDQPVSERQLNQLGVYVQDTNPNAWSAQLTESQVIISETPQSDPALVVTSDGQFNLLDDNLSIDISSVDSINDLQTYDVYGDSILQFSIFVNPANDLQVQDPTEIQTTSTRTIRYTPPQPEFQDLQTTDPSYDAITRLQELGIVEGVTRNNQVFFEPEREILRSEFSKIILEALCLSPSAQAKLSPQVFSDIPFSQNDPLWYYDYTKETQLLGLFNGYLAEQDPQTGLYPFKPANSITLAEATKVILEALEYKSIIQFDLNPNPNQPWYTQYIQIAQDLSPYITDQAASTNQLQNNQLLTTAEASNPNQLITREEFAIIASRVLDLYNCYELEEQSSQDQSSEGQSPGDQGNNNNQSSQDSGSSQNQQSESIELIFPNPQRPGLYIDQIPCNSCPCAYTISDENDIIRRDIIFAILEGPNGEIYSQSNLLTITQ